MTDISPYGPPPAAAAPAPAPAPERSPVVVPVDSERGWSEADQPRRIAAAAAAPLAVAMCAVLASGVLVDLVAVLWLVVGPATFYSAARVLRPEPRHAERTSRHLLSSAAMSFAVPGLWSFVVPQTFDLYGGGSYDGGAILGLLVLAAVLGLVTIAWGLVAVVVRTLMAISRH